MNAPAQFCKLNQRALRLISDVLAELDHLRRPPGEYINIRHNELELIVDQIKRVLRVLLDIEELR
jgi:hypothetical protein